VNGVSEADQIAFLPFRAVGICGHFFSIQSSTFSTT
jgi:hypothetical protein